jgi:hypothetical protein
MLTEVRTRLEYQGTGASPQSLERGFWRAVAGTATLSQVGVNAGADDRNGANHGAVPGGPAALGRQRTRPFMPLRGDREWTAGASRRRMIQRTGKPVH